MKTQRAANWRWIGYGLTVLASCAFAWIAVLAVGGGKTAPTALGTTLLWVFGVASILLTAASLLWLEPAVRPTRRWEPFVLCIVTWLMAAVVVPVLVSAKVAGTKSACLSNIKQNGTAVFVYIADFDDRLPPSDRWQEASQPYWGGAEVPRKCPDAKSPYTYALNRSVEKQQLEKIEDVGTVMLFECDAFAPNPSGGREWFSARHSGRGTIYMVGGNVKFAEPNDSGLRWRP